MLGTGQSGESETRLTGKQNNEPRNALKKSHYRQPFNPVVIQKSWLRLESDWDWETEMTCPHVRWNWLQTPATQGLANEKMDDYHSSSYVVEICHARWKVMLLVGWFTTWVQNMHSYWTDRYESWCRYSINPSDTEKFHLLRMKWNNVGDPLTFHLLHYFSTKKHISSN